MTEKYVLVPAKATKEMCKAADGIGALYACNAGEVWSAMIAAAAAREGLADEDAKRLTDADINTIAESMPGGMAGFLKGWGWKQFARAVEDESIILNSSAQSSGGEASEREERARFDTWLITEFGNADDGTWDRMWDAWKARAALATNAAKGEAKSLTTDHAFALYMLARTTSDSCRWIEELNKSIAAQNGETES